MSTADVITARRGSAPKTVVPNGSRQRFGPGLHGPSVDRAQLVFAIHVLFALGMAGLGTLRIVGGDPIGGGVNYLLAVGIVGVGFYVSRLE